MQDRLKAIEWFQKAASQGHIKAQFNLNTMHNNSEDAVQNYANDIETVTANDTQSKFEVPDGYRLPINADIIDD